jgi:hypothetical protein
MPIHPNVTLQVEMAQRQARADQEQLRAIYSRLLKTQDIIERATIAIAESRALLVLDAMDRDKPGAEK